MQCFDLPAHVARFLGGCVVNVSSGQLAITRSTSPCVATAVNNRTLKGTSFSLTITPCSRRSVAHSISSRWSRPTSFLKLTIRLPFPSREKVNPRSLANAVYSARNVVPKCPGRITFRRSTSNTCSAVKLRWL
ncbi:MAG: hypothetical protein KatS3mg052_2380 [Candidatus Roseilinea sp.]|nr:MAG: hypothetical protein KatS3mg052_2380 [Candidatus Roseilinea sp.]